MTTFKWTEVAFKISEVEVRIAEALKERDDARALAASSQSSLKAVASAADPASQDKALDEIVGSVYFLEENDAERVKVYTSLKNAIQDRNFTVVPTSVLPSNLDLLAPTDAGPAPSPTFQ
ncbi:hypothetical protein GOB91_07275 [Sinorhizobium meliloti]|uniref:hypothetical protein n=1 Tax=Sinorhizobium TaxID=28105 RepID=UPI001296BB78|nr:MULTISPECIES: hypothetical protein [Sinorhizobium]MDW9722157.1 hypothetical protein [Sinorhizobium meliloti]MDW9731385.1 hypothetical protein [Sinorhizobium meliloti]MDX0907431.1 hypothetical protein [Sinorhizobium medicae]MDX1164996.1 hypothetical protein [Sinorhizobium medicae]MQX66316.1 hypothetical protein [Sinorhizobium meliloti]